MTAACSSFLSRWHRRLSAVVECTADDFADAARLAAATHRGRARNGTKALPPTPPPPRALGGDVERRLTADEAVQVALLNNRVLQVTYEYPAWHRRTWSRPGC